MMNVLIGGIKHALGLQCPGRSLLILPDDVFLVSFPKSGNTWTRFLVSNLVHPEREASFGNLRELIPDQNGESKRVFDHLPRPRIIKSHECFEPRCRQVIYIVRDPRDVVISLYHYHRKRRRIEEDCSLETYVERFLAGTAWPHGSWGENVGSWLLTRRKHPQFLLLRYEDMLTDTVGELARIAGFLGICTTVERVSEAVARSSVDQMRKSEKTEGHLSGLTRGSRKDLSFVRAARSGGWRSELSASQAAKIEAAWGPLMQHLGYELSSQAPPAKQDYSSLRFASALADDWWRKVNIFD
jgi:hypothetical protein